jgi:hypothetical protein
VVSEASVNFISTGSEVMVEVFQKSRLFVDTKRQFLDIENNRALPQLKVILPVDEM